MSENTTHICPKCNKSFPCNAKLQRHLTNVKPCELPKKTNTCRYCGITFSRPDNCEKHEKTKCRMNIDALIQREEKANNVVSVNVLKKISKKERDLLEVQETQTTSDYKSSDLTFTNDSDKSTTPSLSVQNSHCEIHTQNNIQEQQNNTINMNFYVLPYTEENTKHITHDYLLKLYDETRMRTAIPKMIKDIHMNPEHPENMNFFLQNYGKDIMLYKSTEDQWEKVDADLAIKDLITHKEIKLDHFYKENKSSLKMEQKTNYDNLKKNINYNNDFQKFLKQTIIDYFIQSKKFMENIVKLDQLKTLNSKQLTEAVEKNQNTFLAIQQIVESDIFKDQNDSVIQLVKTD
jgi:hypothetical protein